MTGNGRFSLGLGQSRLLLGSWIRQSTCSERSTPGGPWLYCTHIALATVLGLKGEVREQTAVCLRPDEGNGISPSAQIRHSVARSHVSVGFKA